MPKITCPRIMVAGSFLGLAAALGGTAAAASFATGQPGMQNQSIHSLAGMTNEPPRGCSRTRPRGCSRTRPRGRSRIDQQG
jgi:hypothetical protein